MSSRNRKCVLNYCGATQKKNPEMRFSQFPPYKSLRFKQWCAFTQLELPPTRHYICHKHFQETDFFKNKMLYHAMPSLHLGTDEEGVNNHNNNNESDDPSTSKYKPFNRLLENIVFTFSGFQSLVEAEIRERALAMGAKYEQVWDSDVCTHLICAFKNTPKYKQAVGHCKIVKKDWILNCYWKRKRLQWRTFALDESEASGICSDEEIIDIAFKPRVTQNNNVKYKKKSIKTKSLPIIKDNQIVIDADTDDDDVQIINTPIEKYVISSDGSESDDTEDEILKM